MSMSSDFDQIGSNGIVDELIVFRYELVQALLNDLGDVSLSFISVLMTSRAYVVAVQVLDEGDDVHRQSVNERSDLLGLPGRSKEIDHLLNSPRSVHVERDANKIIGNRLDDGSSLFVGRVLQKLLTEVVSEWIRHEFWEMTVGLSEDHISVSWFAILQFLLEVSTPVLILAQVEELALEIFDSDTSETVDYGSAPHLIGHAVG